jgi:DNA (cytosine-5)-methyltransferase 1
MNVKIKWIDYIQYIIIDLFCGAGGTTEGFEKAELTKDDILTLLIMWGLILEEAQNKIFKLAKVVACVNHDPVAIESHWANHPDVKHFEEDITLLYGCIRYGVLFQSPQFRRLVRLIEIYRACYPDAKIILWASLECTNFSKAKGGKPRDADSRTLADHLKPYILALDPDYVKIENVVEFMSWGPMIPKEGKTPEGYPFTTLHIWKDKKRKTINIGPHLVPESKKKGKDWIRWRKSICDLGYRDEWRELNSADFGALTSRNRLFGCFAKPGLPIVWPEPTHSKKPEKTSIYKPLKKWNPVKNALDFSDEGNSVFNRKKPLSTKTMQRLFMGCVKHIAGGKKAFMSRYYGGNPEYRNHDLEHPAGTITTNNRMAVVKACFIDQRNGGDPENKNISIEDPARTLTATGGNQQLVQAFISKYYSGNPDHKNISIDGPAGTIKCKDSQALVFITKAFSSNSGKGVNAGSSVDDPCPTVAVQNRLGVAKACFIQKYNSNRAETGGNNGHSVDEPAPVIATQPRMALAQAHFISRYNGVNGGKHDNSHGVESPVGALGTGDNHAKVTAQFLQLYYSGGGQDGSIEDPAGTIPTKDRISKVQADFFLDKQFSGEHNHQSIDQPAGSILTNDKHKLVKAEKWLMNTNYNNVGKSLEEPAPVITADRHHHYLINPSWGGNPGSIEQPCPVVIARQDKAPLYLITCQERPVAVPVYDTDCEWTIKLKEFMALYSICDIKMRMLKVMELKVIQGFPENYVLKGNQTDQKKFIGNAVHPYVPEQWIKAFSYKSILKMAA